VLRVLDLAVIGITKGRAENADRIGPVALDFKMDGWFCFNGY